MLYIIWREMEKSLKVSVGKKQNPAVNSCFYPITIDTMRLSCYFCSVWQHHFYLGSSDENW